MVSIDNLAVSETGNIKDHLLSADFDELDPKQDTMTPHNSHTKLSESHISALLFERGHTRHTPEIDPDLFSSASVRVNIFCIILYAGLPVPRRDG